MKTFANRHARTLEEAVRIAGRGARERRIRVVRGWRDGPPSAREGQGREPAGPGRAGPPRQPEGRGGSLGNRACGGPSPDRRAHHASCAGGGSPDRGRVHPRSPRPPAASRRRRSAMRGPSRGISCSGPGAGTTETASPATRRGEASVIRLPARTSCTRSLGGGPSFIVHPSDLGEPHSLPSAPSSRSTAPQGRRALPGAEFFVLPSADPERENVLDDDEVLAAGAPSRTSERNA